MIVNVISLFDRLVGAYTAPAYTKTDKKYLAEEYRRAIVSAPEKLFDLKDRELYLLGTFDDERCEFNLLEKPEFLCRLDDFFPKKEETKDGE